MIEYVFYYQDETKRIIVDNEREILFKHDISPREFTISNDGQSIKGLAATSFYKEMPVESFTGTVLKQLVKENNDLSSIIRYEILRGDTVIESNDVECINYTLSLTSKNTICEQIVAVRKDGNNI